VKQKGDLLSSWSGRAFVAGLALLIGVGLAGVSALLSNTYGAAAVAKNAQQLHWTNATIGAAAISRAAIAQAVFFSFDDRSDDDGQARAIEEARTNLATLAEALTGEDSNDLIDTRIGAFLEEGMAVVELANAGDSSNAESQRLNTLEPLFEELKSELSSRQTELASQIAESESTAGAISRITFVAISFIIPAITMVIFWLLLRRRMREREAEIQTYLEAERELNRAKDDFIASLSHELRTPLTTIVGFTEILAADTSISGTSREHLHLISASSADLSRMVNDLLTAARLDAEALTIQMQTVDLRDEVETAASPYIRAGEPLHIRIPDLEVYADPLHVRQVVHNLLSNALRHGGEQVVITASANQGNAVLVVADNGPGVPEDLEEKLFQRFFHKGRQALVAGSVGLGLAISNELARRMGGSLRYERVDGWTKFSLKLPSVPTFEHGAKEPMLAGVQAEDRM